MRTDMAIESRELMGAGKFDGISEENFEDTGMKISRITVENEKGSDAIGKPVGVYTTIDLPKLADYDEAARSQIIAKELDSLLPNDGTVLVAGLGNSQITPDALGPKTASKILATRHLSRQNVKITGLEGLRSVAVIAPGVLGQTGMETSEILRSICSEIKPSAVIIIDAMASRHTQRIGSSIQICNTGISPGAGVGNNRPKLNRDALGAPVIAMGIPTVVDASTLAADLTGNNNFEKNETDPLIVTPREIDFLIDRASALLSLSINCALHPDFSPDDFALLTA